MFLKNNQFYGSIFYRLFEILTIYRNANSVQDRLIQWINKKNGDELYTIKD